MTPEDRLLISVLGRTDSLWWPSREKFDLRREQALQERRRTFGAAGLPFSVGGTDSDRQTATRQLDTLRAAGALEVFSEGGRRTGVKLTAAGEARAQRLCGCYTVAEAWGLLVTIGVLDREWDGDSWPEHLLVANEWDGNAEQSSELQAMRQRLVPFLPGGLVEAFGDSGYPRCYWLRLSAAGRLVLAAGPPDDAPADVKFSQRAAALYDASWDAYAAELRDAKPAREQDLALPLPCGIGWGSRAALRKVTT